MIDEARARAMRPIIQSLIDQGQMLEAAWQSFRLMALPIVTGSRELDAFKETFFAGAAATFETMMHAMEEGHQEPTEADLRRMDALAAEVNKWDDYFRLKYGPSPQGSA